MSTPIATPITLGQNTGVVGPQTSMPAPAPAQRTGMTPDQVKRWQAATPQQRQIWQRRSQQQQQPYDPSGGRGVISYADQQKLQQQRGGGVMVPPGGSGPFVPGSPVPGSAAPRLQQPKPAAPAPDPYAVARWRKEHPWTAPGYQAAAPAPPPAQTAVPTPPSMPVGGPTNMNDFMQQMRYRL